MTAETVVVPYVDASGFRSRVFVGENPTVHAYATGADPEEFPVTVKAPIITGGMTKEGVQPLFNFVNSIETHNNKEVAAEEAQRLEQHYFGGLSIYLTCALNNADPESMPGQNKEELKKLITPGKLSAAFNAIAAYTRNTIISEVMILPRDIKNGPAWKMFMQNFNPTFKYGKHDFSFGFLQIYEGGNWQTARSSTTVPTFTLDAKLMKQIEPHQPAELYHHLQRVLTDMNHDMLHHFHSPYINRQIAHKFLGLDKDRWAGSIMQWARSLVGGEKRVEEWSQVSHGKIYMAPENAPLVKKTAENVESYFDELARIGKALPKDDAHEIVDYFGTIMAQTLSRTFPFNHPLMTRCLERLQTADPLSERELRKKAIAQLGTMTGKAIPDDIRSGIESSPVLIDIIKGYRQDGLDILPDKDEDVNFKGLKLLQLAILDPDDMRSHVPEPVSEMEKKVRADSDRAFFEMLFAVAKTTAPRSPK